MRARETELAEIYPLHVVCAWIGNMDRQHGSATWIGNTPKDSYLQVTVDHFAKAAQNPAQRRHEHRHQAAK
jgi:hypothetical protein